MSQPIQQVWRFNSDSAPNKEYETLRYLDGSTSCNCAGWTRRVGPEGGSGGCPFLQAYAPR